MKPAFPCGWRGLWHAWLLLVLLWLAVCAWMARPLPSWTSGWVGWWSGDRMESRPDWSFLANLRSGSEIAPVDGNPAIRVAFNGSVQLGNWRHNRQRWTWAAWVRISTASGAWPQQMLAVGTAESAIFKLRIGFDRGAPAVLFGYRRDANSFFEELTLKGGQPLPLGKWHHLSFSSDGSLMRLAVNGVPVAESHGNFFDDFSLVDLRIENPVPGAVVHLDDLVLFERALPLDDLAAWANLPRGAWPREIRRAERADRLWRAGGPAAVFFSLLAIVLGALPDLRGRAGENLSQLARPAYRSVRWTLAVGLIASAILALGAHGRARDADQERFNSLASQFQQELDDYWSRCADLLVRARDWIGTQGDLAHDDWNAWRTANHFPHRYPGVIGIGYAEQVLPGSLAAHEAVWSARHRFAYRVHPGPSAPRHMVRELEGDPFLPVVLYYPWNLPTAAWFTNRTILGHDLLFQSLSDLRPWAAARRVEEVAARNEIQTSSVEEIAPAAWYGKPVHGIRMYVPWTLRNKADDPLVVLESSAWRGVAFASVDLREAMRARFAGQRPQLGFRIFTGNPGGERFDRVMDSSEIFPETASPGDAYLRSTLEIPFYYRRLFVDLWTTRAFEAQSARRWPWILGGSGSAFTFLAAALLVVQIRARERQGEVLASLRAANSELLLAYREREQFSRDLHDGSIQNLYALGLHLQRIQQLADTAPERMRGELQGSLELLDHAIAELRRFILSAGIDRLGENTTLTALHSLAARLRKTTGVDLLLDVEAGAETLDPWVGVQLLHIVREAVSNSLRHGRARTVEIRLHRQSPGNGASQPDDPLQDRWQLTLQDDGEGLISQTAHAHGRGLKNIAARAHELGGSHRIENLPGAGVRLTLEFSAPRASSPKQSMQEVS